MILLRWRKSQMPDLIQERTLDGRKIIRVGRGQYIVASHSRPGTAYTVDLGAHEGLGHCECENFLYKKLPLWETIQANYDHLRCKHIRSVRNHILDQIIKHFEDKP